LKRTYSYTVKLKGGFARGRGRRDQVRKKKVREKLSAKKNRKVYRGGNHSEEKNTEDSYLLKNEEEKRKKGGATQEQTQQYLSREIIEKSKYREAGGRNFDKGKNGKRKQIQLAKENERKKDHGFGKGHAFPKKGEKDLKRPEAFRSRPQTKKISGGAGGF